MADNLIPFPVDRQTMIAAPSMSPEQAAVVNRAVRRCMVCSRPLGPRNRTGYCPAHPADEWRWLECSEPGCQTVRARRIRGEDRWTCPRHRKTGTLL